MRLRRAFCVLIGALLIGVTSACTSTSGEAAAPAASASGGPGLPAGWRWESYGGVEVGVPGDWGWDNATQRLHQWCVVKPEQKVKPVVARPGAGTLVGCPDGDTVLANTGTVVGFSRTDAADGVTNEGDRTTVRLDTVEVVVQTPAELRQRIVDTIRRSRLDSNGCAATHAVSAKPQWRPGNEFKIHDLRNVSAISVCKYQVGEQLPGAPPRLLASTRLDGAAGAQVIAAVAAAPDGSGPNEPASCAKDHAYGNEIIVLRVRADRAPTQIVVRYSGCDHRGFDDGATVSRLTATALAPVIAGPHAVGVTPMLVL